jgi:phosphoesterase RecJ-like protein
MDNYNEKYDVIKGRTFIYHGDVALLPCDVFIAVDCADFGRIAAPKELFDRAAVTVNIDHHINNGNFATHNFIDETAASTCEIIFDIVNLAVPMSKYIAEALYAGIVTDTGSFRYSATSPKTMEIAALLMGIGIDFGRIQQAVICSRSKVEVAIFTRALQNLQFAQNGIAFTTLTLKELAEAGAKKSDLENIVEYILNIDNTLVSAIFVERENGRIKISLRSHSVDISKVAAHFGGGGHKFAAAADFEADFADGIAQVLEILDRAIDYA